MFTLVIGGSASGKSEYAEQQVMALPGRQWYLATMEPWDDECVARIAKHQAARAQREFTTLECYRNLPALILPPGGNVLLECLSNLTANERYGPDGRGRGTAVLAGVEHLLRAGAPTSPSVTDEVFSGGAEDYEGDTLRLSPGPGLAQPRCWPRRAGPGGGNRSAACPTSSRRPHENFVSNGGGGVFHVLRCAHAPVSLGCKKYALCPVRLSPHRGVHRRLGLACGGWSAAGWNFPLWCGGQGCACCPFG